MVSDPLTSRRPEGRPAFAPVVKWALDNLVWFILVIILALCSLAIPGFFQITHVHNRGAAFGIFADSPSEWKIAALVMFSIVALAIVSVLLWRNSHSMHTTGIGLALILGGAVGNLWDRLLSGRVVDFLLFYVGQYQWPAFNVADSAIVVGAGLLVVEILFGKSSAPEKST